MATIDEVKAELERRGAWNFVEHKRRLHFLIVPPDGYTSSRSWIEDNQWGNETVVDVVDRIWPESVARDVPEEIQSIVCTHMRPGELVQWLSETLEAKHVAVTVSGNGRVIASWTNKSGSVLEYNSGRNKVTARECINDILCGMVRVVDCSTQHCAWLDNWAEFVGAAPRNDGELDESFRRRLSEELRRTFGAPLSPQAADPFANVQGPPDEWVTECPSPLDSIQRLLHHDRRKDAKPTPAGIARLIRDGIAPHEYPQREGKIELGVRGECRCVLCSLPRGNSWGEVELQQRIEWMGQQVHDSLHAMGAWLSRGKTKTDRFARYGEAQRKIHARIEAHGAAAIKEAFAPNDPLPALPFDSTGRYREIVRDVLKGPLFSQRQKGSSNGK